ncbi:TetR/AcrR family transcriptional regulator [Rhizohabitans arisaemae]|uniref:TetR/AcrR family transcriptional regulator n=1 Tax=Rhizohabitans arisaemae TaxID=2720610 RepID=UPI0024B1EE17|nr:TetR/AcrR family transcriptional regulator [Rhizohabitans arisaemae]
MDDIRRSRGGRPRDEGASQRILTATLEVVAEYGLAKTTVEAVARRAGVGRPTVYRRWPELGPLVSDAVSMAFAQVGAGVRESDDVADVLETLLRDKLTVLTTTVAGDLIKQLAPYFAARDALGTALSQAQRHQRESLTPTLRRAQQEGRLILPSVPLAAESVLGIIYLRLLTGDPELHPDQAPELVAITVRPRDGEYVEPNFE